MHPNEVKLCFKGTSGAILPTREFSDIDCPSNRHSMALSAQLDRQMIELNTAKV